MSATGKQLGGATGKGWRPGQSGNPGGRQKGLAARVRARTRDGQALVDYFADIFEGKPITLQTEKGPIVAYPSLKDRTDAAYWLSDRGHGKAPITVAEDAEDAPRHFRLVWAGGQPVDPEEDAG